ncbi:MAG: prolyl oligopeptidase family serine peptidase [Candidatus Omnitrophica bacterium]|nr:prolyl oligopeptidase family serine peptidase [Candidatus Omnitrophota bacterium]
MLTAIQGCAYAPLREGATHTLKALPQELVVYYDYPAHRHEAVSLLIRHHAAFSEYLVRFPLSLPAGLKPTEPVVEFEWFESHAVGRRGAIVFNPILGGDYPVERGVCRTFARQGWHVALVHRKTLKVSPEHEVAHLERLLRQGMVRIRQVTDWMTAHERVDAARLGSFGISMGGIVTVMAAAVEPRLHAHVIALAGGPLADILTSSPDRMIRQPRGLYLARNRMDLETMERLLREAVHTDPIRLAPYVDRRRVFMVIALADRTIGRANALRLWRALGRPQAVFLPFGHYTAYLSLPYLQYAGLRFLNEQLASP